MWYATYTAITLISMIVPAWASAQEMALRFAGGSVEHLPTALNRLSMLATGDEELAKLSSPTSSGSSGDVSPHSTASQTPPPSPVGEQSTVDGALLVSTSPNMSVAVAAQYWRSLRKGPLECTTTRHKKGGGDECHHWMYESHAGMLYQWAIINHIAKNSA